MIINERKTVPLYAESGFVVQIRIELIETQSHIRNSDARQTEVNGFVKHPSLRLDKHTV
jgi:hypothetical protein